MRILTLFLLLFLSFNSLCQPDFEIQGLNVSEQLNLPSLETYKIKKDSKGNIWVLTDAGVIRYNGSTTQTYTTSDGLTNSTIFDLYEDQFDRIWFLGLSLDLCYYKDGKIHQYSFNSKLRTQLQGKVKIWKELYIDSNENLYYSVYGIGCYKISKNGIITHLEQQDGVKFWNIEQHSLISFNMLKDSYRSKSNADSICLELYANNKVKQLTFQEANSIIQSNKKIEGNNYKIIYHNLFRDNKRIKTESKNVYVTPYLDEILVATSKGFYKGNILTNSIERNTPIILPNEYITSVLVDNFGAIWVSTLENGIYYFSDINLKSSTYISKVTDKNIQKIFSYKNELYALSYTHMYNLSTSQSTATDDNNQYCDYVISNDRLILSKGGLAHVEETEFCIITPFSRDLKAYGNKLYVSSSDRVYSINLDNLQREAFLSPLDNSHFSYSKKIAVIDSATLLHSSLEKIRILKKHKVVKEFESKYDVQQMESLADNSILILDKVKGLYKLNPKTLELYALDSINIALAKAEYTCFYYSEENDTYYIGSSAGVLIYSNATKRLQIIDKNKGISSNQINSVFYKNGELYFGVKGNVYKYSLTDSPTQPLSNNKSPNTVVLTSDSSTIDLKHQNKITIPSTEKFIVFKLNTFSYSNWFNKQYQFRTDTSNTWITTNSASFTLTNLYGNYNIQARYKLDPFTWSAPIPIIQIRITPPWYKHWLMVVFYIISIGLLILFLLRFRLNKKMKKLQIENNLLSYQQRLQNARIKPHFIFNVLNSINSHILFNENKEASNYLIKFSKLLRNLLEKSGEDVIKIEHEIDLIESFLNLEQIRHTNFTYSITVPRELRNLYIPTLMIQPIVENAVIHGIKPGCDNHINLSIKKETDQSVYISIANNSIIDSKKVEKWHNSMEGHAIHITKNRIDNYKKLYKLNNLRVILNTGTSQTEVCMILPLVTKENLIAKK